jgi:protein-disulfide isomerase
VTLDHFKGERTLVVFWNPDCSFCGQMLDELKRIETSPPPSAPRMLVISKGSVEANRAAGLRSPVVLDDDFTVGKQFGASGTPSAVLIDQHGHIASELVGGAPDVLALAGVRKAAR